MTYSHLNPNIKYILNKLDIDFIEKVINYYIWHQAIMQNFR